jgi:hypothetical protein
LYHSKKSLAKTSLADALQIPTSCRHCYYGFEYLIKSQANKIIHLEKIRNYLFAVVVHYSSSLERVLLVENHWTEVIFRKEKGYKELPFFPSFSPVFLSNL